MKAKVLLIITIFFSNNLFGQEEIFGFYSSNVAELGFFVTSIKLNKDYTFNYEFHGDLIHQMGKGTFEISDKKEILLDFENKNKEDSTNEDFLSSEETIIEDQKFKYKNGKLFLFHIDGYIVKRGQAYSRHKKFLFWGEKYLTKRRIYLKKRNL